mmetsp:Transcript_12342/g.14992  ORF Transcript_12342/g.14992 Transcript_12342/m.14992 type:complete len:212 (+) Transcript_12342:217-852(+)
MSFQQSKKATSNERNDGDGCDFSLNSENTVVCGDGAKGILSAVNKELPLATLMYDSNHASKNISDATKRDKAAMANLYKQQANALTLGHLQQARSAMNEDAKTWLETRRFPSKYPNQKVAVSLQDCKQKLGRDSTSNTIESAQNAMINPRLATNCQALSIICREEVDRHNKKLQNLESWEKKKPASYSARTSNYARRCKFNSPRCICRTNK